MIEFPPRQWLAVVPWESVLSVNKALCQDKKVDYRENSPALEQVRNRWESAVPRSSSLVEVLELFRECNEALPFTHYNGRTFAAVTKVMVDEWLKAMKPLEAQILRATMCHFVAGEVGKKELLQVLKHFSPACEKAASAQMRPDSTEVPGIEPQAAV